MSRIRQCLVCDCYVGGNDYNCWQCGSTSFRKTLLPVEERHRLPPPRRASPEPVEDLEDEPTLETL